MEKEVVRGFIDEAIPVVHIERIALLDLSFLKVLETALILIAVLMVMARAHKEAFDQGVIRLIAVISVDELLHGDRVSDFLQEILGSSGDNAPPIVVGVLEVPSEDHHTGPQRIDLPHQR